MPFPRLPTFERAMCPLVLVALLSFAWSAHASPAVVVETDDVWRRTLPDLDVDALQRKYGRAGAEHTAATVVGRDAVPSNEFEAQRSSLLAALREPTHTPQDMEAIVNRTEQLLRDTLARYYTQTPQLRELLRATARNASLSASDAVEGQAVLPLPGVAAATSFLQLSGQAKEGALGMQGGCEVCVYVMENKQMRQPFLCRGLKAAQYQQACVSVLVSLMWWLENEVYWVNYGCQRQNG